MTKKWTEVNAGAVNAATQRILVGMGDEANRIVARINSDPKYLAIIIDAARGGLKRLKPISDPIKTRSVTRFNPQERFVQNTKKFARVHISEMDDEFKKGFLSFLSKAEDYPMDVTYYLHYLYEESSDENIILELGDRHKTSLYGFYEALAYKEKNGIFASIASYITDACGVLYVVRARWHVAGWSISAHKLQSATHLYIYNSEFLSR